MEVNIFGKLLFFGILSLHIDARVQTWHLIIRVIIIFIAQADSKKTLGRYCVATGALKTKFYTLRVRTNRYMLNK